MIYSIFIPKAELKPFVECYWMVKGEGMEKQIVVPDGCSELIFHFGDNYRIEQCDGTFQSQHASLIAGQITKSITLEPSGYSCVLGIKLKPDGLWRMFGLPMSEFTNSVFPLSDVLHLVDWQRRLSRMNDELKIREVENLLSRQLTKSKHWISLDTIIRKIETSKGSITIKKVSDEFNISERKLQRMFSERIGVSAKMYARITRFKNVYRLLQESTHSKTDVAYLHGYFDQSHFTNEFRELTGYSPEAWFRLHQPMSKLFMNL